MYYEYVRTGGADVSVGMAGGAHSVRRGRRGRDEERQAESRSVAE